MKRLNRIESLPEQKIPFFNKVFERRKALLRHIEAPLLEERLKYLQYWADSGAKDGSLRRIAQYLLVIMDYLNFFELRMVSVIEIENAAESWASNKVLHLRKGNYSKFAKVRFVNDASHWFDMLGCLQKPGAQPIPFKEELDKYNDYMLKEQGLSEKTIYGRSFQLKDFLKNVSEKKKILATISPLDIDEVLAKKHDVDGYSRRTVQTYASVIRSLLNFRRCNKTCDHCRQCNGYHNINHP